MKKPACIAVLPVLAAMFLLCACGAEAPAAEPRGAGAIGAGAVADAAGEPADAPASEARPASAEAAPARTGDPEAPAVPEEPDARAVAESLTGEDVALLYAAIGEPLSSDYAPSCLVDGEDGELDYGDFIVYTLRENGAETVYVVE